MFRGKAKFFLELLFLGTYKGTIKCLLFPFHSQGRPEHRTPLTIPSSPLPSPSPLLLEENCIFDLGDYTRSSQREGVWPPLCTKAAEAAVLKRVAEILWKFRVWELLYIVLEHLYSADVPHPEQEWGLLLSHKT